MIDRDFQSQLRGWSLTTAEIMYRMPDYREILQTFIWQDYDLAPKFPKLIKFLDFWSHNLDGPLASVRVAHAGIIRPVEMHYVGSEWQLH
ncbi:MAG: usg protein [Hyphomicrobiales bacterium]